MNILGISAFYHDAAAAIISDGDIVAAAQEERFTRKKHDSSFPVNAIKYCLKEAKIDMSEVNYVAFYDKPFLKMERLLETYLSYAPKGFKSFISSMPSWIRQKIYLKAQIQKFLDFDGMIIFPEHHHSHAASAFYPSPFQEAAILTIDGVGEWATTSFGYGKDNGLVLTDEIRFPHSLGLLYSAFTYFCGFRVNSGEYKLMGLAPYGEPKYVDLILDHVVDLKDDGSFRLNLKYFNYCTGLTMTNHHLENLFATPRREAESKMTQVYMDIARSIQVVTEEIVLKIATHVHKQTGMKNLCMAGGVALNCVANGRVQREGPFDRIWVQPASSDSGGALGAALIVWNEYLNEPRKASGTRDIQKASLLGPSYSDQEIKKFLIDNDIPFEEITSKDFPSTIAKLLNDQNVIGWFQGRMEFGPRALGARSILGDPRSEKMQSIINLKIKFRESFRPFAPSVLQEKAEDYFELNGDSPYMLMVSPIKSEKRVDELNPTDFDGFDKLKVKRSEIPAITHVDYSARVQTVTREDNPKYYDMIHQFSEKYGCPLVINTSFNVRGEPIVCTPEDSYRCFMRTNMDFLVAGSFLVDKKKQDPSRLKLDEVAQFALD